MTLENAEIKLAEFTNKMREENSKISYAAIIEDQSTYKIELGFISKFEIINKLNQDLEKIARFESNEVIEISEPLPNGQNGEISVIYKLSSYGINFFEEKEEEFHVLSEEDYSPISVSNCNHPEIKGSVGAYFFFEQDCYIITNFHNVAKYNTRNYASLTILNHVGFPNENMKNLRPIGHIAWKAFTNEVDVAICKVTPKFLKLLKANHFVTEIQNITVPKIGKVVKHHNPTGINSNYTIKSINASVKIENINSKNENKEVKVFTNQIMTDMKIEHGDSGKVIFDDGKAVGLTFATHISLNRGFHNSIFHINEIVSSQRTYDHTDIQPRITLN